MCHPREGQELTKAQKDQQQLRRSLDFSVLFCTAASRDFINGFTVFQQFFELQAPEARQLHGNCHLKNPALICVGLSLKVWHGYTQWLREHLAGKASLFVPSIL